jgi:predicted SAM-dependent methyltransferase
VATPLRYRIRQSPLGRRLPHGLSRFIRAYHYLLHGHLARTAIVRRYLRSTDEPRLQIGGGPNLLDGWLNSDLVHGQIFLNVTRRFPIPDASLAYVFSEHMIEHVSEEQGLHVIRESFRVLRPGGVLRLTTPDLRKVITIYEDDNPSVTLRDYLAFLDETLPHDPHPRAAQMLNTYMRAWGHQYVYDEEDLTAKLLDAGFSDVKRVEPGESEHAALRGLESHEPPWANAAEAMCLEATRPGSS